MNRDQQLPGCDVELTQPLFLHHYAGRHLDPVILKFTTSQAQIENSRRELERLQLTGKCKEGEVTDFVFELDGQTYRLSYAELHETLKRHEHNKVMSTTPYYAPDHHPV
jgi:hypothetical protein